MHLSQLKTEQFRNLASQEIEFCSNFNYFFGNNGSGKTSLLEAIYFLGMGRSFRTRTANRLINNDSEKMLLFGLMQSEGQDANHLPIGIERYKTGKNRIKIDGKSVSSTAELALQIPIQTIHSDSFHLLDSGPKYRRQFLDWGLFHVEQSFFSAWKNFQRVIKQRNAAIKQGRAIEEIQLWDSDFVSYGNTLDELRKKYLTAFLPVFTSMVKELLPEFDVEIDYLRGWKEDCNLASVLSEGISRDRFIGHSQFGPHRCELFFHINQVPVCDALSRGQQKLLLCALLLAQGRTLQDLAEKPCIYLIDELAAELDEERQTLIGKLLSEINAQVFVTAVNQPDLARFSCNKAQRMFHVEHGQVNLMV